MNRFTPKRALMFWCRLAGIAGGTKPERFARLAILRWREQLPEFDPYGPHDYETLAKRVEMIVRRERRLRAQRKARAAEAQMVRDMGLI